MSNDTTQMRSDIASTNAERGGADKSNSASSEKDFRKGVWRDIYRTGAMMYELLTVIGVSQNACADTLKELEDREQEWKAKGKPRMLKAPELKPENRYQSAEEMLRELWELPKIDEYRTAHMRLAVIDGAAALLLGVFLLFTGLNQIRRTVEMRNPAWIIWRTLEGCIRCGGTPPV